MDSEVERAERAGDVEDVRSVAQLNMLHSLAARLNALGSVAEIGAAITSELRTILDFHNCRVYVVEPDGVTLMPIAFRGDLADASDEYAAETLEALITVVGEGITGHVAATGVSLLTANAQEIGFAIQIEGTEDIVESMLVVPMKRGDVVVGVIVLSSLGYGRFDDDDRRVLEVLASHAAIAVENARRLTELERFHELMGSLDAVFWEAEGAALTFTFLSGRVEELLGPDVLDWERSELRWGGHIAAEDRAAAIALIDTDHDTNIEYRVETSDGRTVWLRDLVHVVPDRDHKRLRGLMVDATERKRAEEALRRSERKYSDAFSREREAAQRLRALDEMKNTFLEAVSHDLRTPLTAILGSALTLEQAEMELPRDDALDLVHRIATNARKLERLLSDLLDLDRLQRGIVSPQRRPIELAQLVQLGVDETANPSNRQIEVDVEDATVSVDAAKVERILENMLSNALRHTPAEAKIWVRASSQDGGTMLVVEDEGPGVPTDLHEAIFEPFRQVPGSESMHSPGVGVGLSLVLRFAELHGGRAWVEDRPGGGSRFSVFLPND